MRWSVQLTGDRCDLEALSRLFSTGVVRVCEEEQDFRMSADHLEEFETGSKVYENALELAADINGIARLVLDGYKPVRVCAVTDHTGAGHHLVHVDDALTISDRGTVEVDGVEAPLTDLPVGDWAVGAAKDQVVASVLSFYSTSDLSWADLYRLYELILDDVGTEYLEYGVVSEKQVSLFKHTANSPDAIGLNSRHGRQRTEAPSNPMSYEEARRMIDELLKAWLSRRNAST